MPFWRLRRAAQFPTRLLIQLLLEGTKSPASVSRAEWQNYASRISSIGTKADRTTSVSSSSGSRKACVLPHLACGHRAIVRRSGLGVGSAVKPSILAAECGRYETGHGTLVRVEQTGYRGIRIA